MIAIGTVDRFGRRVLMLIGCASIAISHILLGAAYLAGLKGIPVLVLTLCAIGSYGMSLAPITWVLISEIFPNRHRAEGQALERAVLENAHRYGIRLIGPNCLGVMRPGIGLNATFNKGGANTGHLAFVSQSGALCTAILDWAHTNDVGFSSVVSMGSSADVDFGEILDYLVSDQQTHSILMYIEGIRESRRFMSSLRAAARVKPVILVKVGRHEAGSKAAMSHTASLVGSDDAFDAAVRRAGVRVLQRVRY